MEMFGTALSFQPPFSNKNTITDFVYSAELGGNECTTHGLFWFSEQGKEGRGSGVYC